MTQGIQIAFYKGKGLIGNALIRWWTRSIYSHCEVVFGGVCMSSTIMDGGVRKKIIDLSTDHWDVIELPWADDKLVLEHFQATNGQPYGWMDLLTSQIFNRGIQSNKASFCSEWCAEALGIARASVLSPIALFDVVVSENKRYTSLLLLAALNAKQKEAA